MKKILALVAEKVELSPHVVDFLVFNGVTILYTGVGKDSVEASLVSAGVTEYDEVWNIGSVGSSLPLFSVFEVGLSYTELSGDVHVLSKSIYKVRTVDFFVSSAPDYATDLLSVDMELYYIASFMSRCSKEVTLRSFKFVSDNKSEGFTIEDYYKTIAETAFIVSEPLIKLFKKYIL